MKKVQHVDVIRKHRAAEQVLPEEITVTVGAKGKHNPDRGVNTVDYH